MTKENPSNDRTSSDNHNLPQSTTDKEEEHGAGQGNERPLAIRAEAFRHIPDGIGDNGDRCQLEAVYSLTVPGLGEQRHLVDMTLR